MPHMTRPIGAEASIPNPSLAGFSAVIGTWTTTGTHPMVPGTTFHGRTSFEWHEGGAFVVMRSEIDEPDVPSGIAIFGSDGAPSTLSMLYFDERAVARHYQVAINDSSLRWWRTAPDMSQRYTIAISADGHTLRGTGEFSRDGGAWGPDLALTYTRQPSS